MLAGRVHSRSQCTEGLEWSGLQRQQLRTRRIGIHTEHCYTLNFHLKPYLLTYALASSWYLELVFSALTLNKAEECGYDDD